MLTLISDYDRTLTNKELDLCNEIINMIRKLKKDENLRFIVASGRTLDFLQNKLSDCADGFVAENGAVIYYNGKKEVFGRNESEAIKAALKSMELVYFGEIIGYALLDAEKIIKDNLESHNIKFSIERNKNSIMIMPPFVNKGYGISKIIDAMDLRSTIKIAMGDDENDITMLKAVDFPVALANSDDRLKAMAKFITKSEYCDGALEFLQQLKILINAKSL